MLQDLFPVEQYRNLLERYVKGILKDVETDQDLNHKRQQETRGSCLQQQQQPWYRMPNGVDW